MQTLVTEISFWRSKPNQMEVYYVRSSCPSILAGRLDISITRVLFGRHGALHDLASNMVPWGTSLRENLERAAGGDGGVASGG